MARYACTMQAHAFVGLDARGQLACACFMPQLPGCGNNIAAAVLVLLIDDHAAAHAVVLRKHEMVQIDMDELRTILTELDGRPPLPKDLL